MKNYSIAAWMSGICYTVGIAFGLKGDPILYAFTALGCFYTCVMVKLKD